MAGFVYAGLVGEGVGIGLILLGGMGVEGVIFAIFGQGAHGFAQKCVVFGQGAHDAPKMLIVFEVVGWRKFAGMTKFE